MENTDNKTTSELRDIKYCLDEASKHGLEIEVIREALYIMKINPNSTISQCMKWACYEWDVI